MAAPGTFTLTQAARQYIQDATDLAGQTSYKAALLTSAWTPAPSTNAVWADISTNEVASGNGYTTGGNTVTSPTVTQTAGVGKWTGTIPSWTASGAGITARYCAIYALGTFNGHVNPILGYFLLDSTPADVVTATGNTLQINAPAAGFFTLT